MSVTTWPNGASLAAWLPDGANLSEGAQALLQDVVDDATDTVLSRVDPGKLPTAPEECPRTIARAIVLEAARLLSRRDSANGVIAFGEWTIRATNNDADVTRLLRGWGLEPEP